MGFETKMKMELMGLNEEEGGFETYRERERERVKNQRGREKKRRLVTCAEIVSDD